MKVIITLLAAFVLIANLTKAQNGIYHYYAETVSTLPMVDASSAKGFGCKAYVLGHPGNKSVAAIGIVWSIDPSNLNFDFNNPNDHCSFSGGTMSFSCNIGDGKPIGANGGGGPSLMPCTTYYLRGFVFGGKSGEYNTAYGNVVQFTTLPSGSTPISNNSITNNANTCNQGAIVTLRGTTPTGGANNSYQYAWQTCTDGESWIPAPGANMNQDYITSAVDPSILYRRVVTCGQSPTCMTQSESEPFNFNYVPSNSLINVSKTASSSALYVKAKALGVNGSFNTRWQQSNSYSGQFDNVAGAATGNSFEIQDFSGSTFYRALMFINETCSLMTSPVFGISASDGDGNYYPYMKIGTQYWMINDLTTTKLNDGTPITPITDLTKWKNANSPAYYNTGSAILYNAFTLTGDKVCPIGWHVAKTADWDALTSFVGTATAGSALASTENWTDVTTLQPTNQVNFNGNSVGKIDSNQKFGNNGSQVVWWDNPGTANTAGGRTIQNSGTGFILYQNQAQQNAGFSIRCVKD